MNEAAHAELAPHRWHHFESSEQQFDSGKLGMWLFLATEVLMFGGLFCAYAIYRGNHPEIFHYGHQFLDKKWGGINTIVLICSSLSMAWAVRAAQLGQKALLVTMLAITLACAGGFMGIKYVEYSHKIHSGLLWGTNYHPTEHALHDAEEAHHELDAATLAPAPAEKPGWSSPTADASTIGPAAAAPAGMTPAGETVVSHESLNPKTVHIFFGIYFAMTGLHGVHVFGGMIVITWLIFGALAGRFGPQYFTPVDLVGLYWHIVDMIWIFLFPLLYLID
jgi:cytochrome c oxidase subunit 3